MYVARRSESERRRLLAVGYHGEKEKFREKERGVPAESSGKEGEVKHNPKSLKDGKYRSKTSDTKMINKKSEREVKAGY